MKTLYHVRIDEDEIEGFFDEDGDLMGAWCLNDARWRNEYMNPLLNSLGYQVEKNTHSALIQALKHEFKL